MTNTSLLEKAIKKSGLEKSTIAKEIGLTEKTFEKKVSGKSAFKCSEVDTLCRILKIETPTEATKIFFAESEAHAQKEGEETKKEQYTKEIIMLLEKCNDLSLLDLILKLLMKSL